MLIAFDMDGTVLLGHIDGIAAGNAAAARVLTGYGVPEERAMEAVRLAYKYTTTRAGGFVTTKHEQLGLCALLAGVKPDAALEEAMFQAFIEGVMPYRHPDPDIPDLFPYLRRSGHRLCVQTNSPHDVALKELALSGILPLVDFVLTADGAGGPKGTRRYAEALAAASPYPAKDILVVGDEESDLVTAMIMGANAVLVDHDGTRETLGVDPAFVINRLGELATVLALLPH